MKNKTSLTISCFLIIFSAVSFCQQETGKVRIGTFDSRCIAIAYARSGDFGKEMSDMRLNLRKAKESGDSVTVKELEQLGPTKQVILHQQGFSTGSVMNIMDKIKENIPVLAKENNLVMILSKWEVAFSDKSVELIDITDQLTAFFNPDDATKKIIENIKAMEPVPIEKVGINPMD